MNKKETISEVCSIVGLAFRSIKAFDHCSDCFCSEDETGFGGSYQNDGIAIDYVRDAVLRQLKADGYKISNLFNPETGKEVSKKSKIKKTLIARLQCVAGHGCHILTFFDTTAEAHDYAKLVNAVNVEIRIALVKVESFNTFITKDSGTQFELFEKAYADELAKKV